MTDGQDVESKMASEMKIIKKKEDPGEGRLGVVGKSCRRGFFRRSFEFTGELSTFTFIWKQIINMP